MSEDNLLFGALYPNGPDGDYNDLVFKMQSVLMKANTCQPVVVTAVRGGGLGPVGFIDCRIAVQQLTGNGQTVDNAILSNVPYHRYQGGKNAVIIDPEIGDMGLVCFAQRDISGVKNVRGISPPGSRRFMSISDGVYVAAMLNATPIQYIWFNDDGILVFSPKKITLEASDVEINASSSTSINSPVITMNGQFAQGGGSYGGDAAIAGTITAGADVKAGNISLANHLTSNVQPGSGTSGKPIPG